MSDAAVPGRFEKILVIDDDKTDRYISVRVMMQANFAGEIVLKTSVKEAISYLSDTINKDSKLPELIFLDWNLRGEEAEDFLKQFKALCKKANRKSIIMILSHMIHTDFVMTRIATEYPMVQAFLEKPLTVETLDDI